MRISSPPTSSSESFQQVSHSQYIELVPKLIDYALKRMVRKLCLRWNKLLQFFRLKPYKTAEF
ncbi:MAG: hypothetical protein LBK66_14965, partial [Spirochaetaceae bacterium]|nr:hypothetical protein [Spirochaetaceae bacterium]